MARQAGAVGRNDRCPCGSGRKYKQCCASKSTRLTRAQVMVLVVVTSVLVGGLVMAMVNRQNHVGQAAGVWSEEHGHYH